jgi:hypothetical protein
MAMATPSHPSAADPIDETPDQDHLEESATGQADPESGDAFEVPAQEFHHDPQVSNV